MMVVMLGVRGRRRKKGTEREDPPERKGKKKWRAEERGEGREGETRGRLFLCYGRLKKGRKVQPYGLSPGGRCSRKRWQTEKNKRSQRGGRPATATIGLGSRGGGRGGGEGRPRGRGALRFVARCGVVVGRRAAGWLARGALRRRAASRRRGGVRKML